MKENIFLICLFLLYLIIPAVDSDFEKKIDVFLKIDDNKNISNYEGNINNLDNSSDYPFEKSGELSSFISSESIKPGLIESINQELASFKIININFLIIFPFALFIFLIILIFLTIKKKKTKRTRKNIKKKKVIKKR